jgi:brefeldin A-inhibited guanine nucleotide-exchange protein
MKANKLEFQEGVALFNAKPTKGVKFLQEAGKLGGKAEEVAAFLRAHAESTLDRTMIGEYLVNETPRPWFQTPL